MTNRAKSSVKTKIPIKTYQHLVVSSNLVKRSKSDIGTTYQTGFVNFGLQRGKLGSQLGPKFEIWKNRGKSGKSRQNRIITLFFKLK